MSVIRGVEYDIDYDGLTRCFKLISFLKDNITNEYAQGRVEKMFTRDEVIEMLLYDYALEKQREKDRINS